MLHLYKAAYPDSHGGVETVIHSLATGMNKNDIKADIVACFDGPKPRTDRIDNYSLRLFPVLFTYASMPISMPLLIWCASNMKKYDVVYLHYPFPFGDAISLFMRRGAKLIVFYHSDIVRQSAILKMLYAPFQFITFSRAKRIVATSSQYLEGSSVSKAFRKKTVVIPIGINDVSKEPEQRPNIDFDFKEPYFLFVGQFRYYKGLSTLLNAAKQSGFPVLLVGSGEEAGSLHSQREKQQIDTVYFAGNLTNSEKNYCYRRCKCVVFPSNARSEAFGVTLLEASAFGKPMITCEIGTGTSFINVASKTGWVIEPNNPETLASAMRQAMESTDEAMKCGMEARKRYLEIFTATKTVSEHINMLQTLR